MEQPGQFRLDCPWLFLGFGWWHGIPGLQKSPSDHLRSLADDPGSVEPAQMKNADLFSLGVPSWGTETQGSRFGDS
jgi:hypothetical protein